jgi:hypothetical protein
LAGLMDWDWFFPLVAIILWLYATRHIEGG